MRYSGIFMDVTAALTEAGLRHGQEPFTGEWPDNKWLNTPGPIYCGMTDNCYTGPLAAPNNIHVDAEGYEVIFRQPVNLYELRQVIEAADLDPWGGYGADGDQHWSYASIREWWARRYELQAELERLYKLRWALEDGDPAYFAGLRRWQAYINDGMHEYLRVYAFFLEEGRIPTEEDRLPEL